MPIDVNCSQCGSSLRVPDEHAGKKARCPKCECVFDIPAGGKANLFAEARGVGTAAPANPYAATTGASTHGNVGGTGAIHEFRPLLDAVFFIKVFAWAMIVVGVIYCLTIIGLIIGWLPIWMGLSLRNAADSLRAGFQTGDRAAFMRASSDFATFFKIVGVITMIYIGLILLYLGVILVALFLGLLAGAAMG